MKHILSTAIGCCLMLISCAPRHTPSVTINPAMASIVNDWHADAKATLGHDLEIADINVDFGDPGEGDDGVCVTTGDKTPRVIIDVLMWNILDDLGRHNLLYHELGHCVLNRVHNSATLVYTHYYDDATYATQTIYTSIMNPHSFIDEEYWQDHYVTVLTEYFGDR